MRKMLSATFVRNIGRPGEYGDLHGLILRVRKGGSKYWFWRGSVRGQRVDYGIGSYPSVTLAEARETAFEYRKLAKAGGDPRGQKDVPTFTAALEKVIAIHRPTWKTGGKTEEQWRTEMARYALPRLGQKPVDRITTSHVMAVLTADRFWTAKPVVAKRTRQRIGAVMKWAVAQGHREDNPAGDALGAALPKHNGRKKHFKALPASEVAAALARVRQSGNWPGVKLAFEFLVLTAARTAEVRGATWSEIDLEEALWTIPADRMKSGREHRVPLSDRAAEILEEFGGKGLLFPSPKGKVLNPTTLYAMLSRLGIPASVHGFRSTFRDWAALRGVRREVAEAALAHVVPGVEGAYRRTDFADERAQVMAEWAAYIGRDDG